MIEDRAIANVDSERAATTYKIVVLAFLLLSILTVLPIALVEVPGLNDYSNHLARIHILTTIDDQPALQKNYLVDWALVPNLAMDAVAPFLAKFLGVFAAGKLFVAACLLLPVIGVAVLHHVLHGRPSLWPAAAFLFTYNQVFAWGFLNYLFTVGLYFLAFAGWIATRHWPHMRRLAVFSVVASILYLGHFFAFSIYGLSIVGYELWLWRERRKTEGAPLLSKSAVDWLWVMAQFIPAGIMLLMVPRWDGPTVTLYGSLTHKVIALMAPFNAYGEQSFIAVLVLAGVALLLFSKRQLAVAPALRIPLILLTVAAVLMPYALAGNWFTDHRLPPVLAMLLVAGTRLKAPRRYLSISLAAIGLLLFVGPLLPTIKKLQYFDAKAAEFRQAAQMIEPGARILPVQAMRSDLPYGAAFNDFWNAYRHLTSLAIIDRSAFTPLLFTNPAAQPVRPAPALAHLDVPYGRPVMPEHLIIAADPERAGELEGSVPIDLSRIYWEDWPNQYDYVFYVSGSEQANPVPKFLEPVETGSFFVLYKVKRAVEPHTSE